MPLPSVLRAGWKFLALGDSAIYILPDFPDRTQTLGECVLLRAGTSSQAHIGRPDLATTAEAPLLCPQPSPVGPKMQEWVLLPLSLWVPW